MWSATKTEGFETKASDTQYQGTVTITTAQSDCGIAWSIYYGNVSTTSAINGSKSCLMRYYTGTPSNLGYAKTTTAIKGLTNITFNAKVTNTGNKMGVWYSTDGSNWVALATNVTLTTSSASKSYDIPSPSTSTNYYIKIGITSGTTNRKDLIIDNVVFTYTDSSPSYTITAQSNNTTYGTVSKDGNVITASPNTCYTYASPAYTVSPVNSATVSQSGNNFTITPSANTTITINFEEKPKYTITYDSIGVTSTVETCLSVTLPTLQTPSECTELSWSFAGWSGENSNITQSDILTGSFTPTKDTTLYAVYKQGGSETFIFSDIASTNNWENGIAYTEVTIGNITIEAQGGGNNGKWYTSSGGSWRMYNGGTVSISSTSGDIESVESSPSCDFTISNGIATFSPSARTDFTEITVNCGNGVYSTNPSCSEEPPIPEENIVDIVVWDTASIKIDVDADDVQYVSIENKPLDVVEKVAKDLFFAKYFEGEGDIKMFSIYNGTNKNVNLNEYKLVLYHRNPDNIHNDANNKIIDFSTIDTVNTIYRGQEIIYFAKDNSVQALSECSNTFFNSIKDKTNETSNPRWIHDQTNISFNGNDALLLIHNTDTIDIFGSLIEPSGKNCRNERGWEGEVLNIDYKKTAADFTETVWDNLSSYGINITDSILTGIYTARCVLYRNKDVLSGDSAVKKNKSIFDTFTPDEWYGRNICANGVVSGAGTCNSFSDLGTFDYGNYYGHYENIFEKDLLSSHHTPEDSTYLFNLTKVNLDTLPCTELKIVLEKTNGDIKEEIFKVPIFISSNKTADNFNPLHVDTCKNCDVVILGDAALTVAGNTLQSRNVTVYPGGRLIVPFGTKYKMNSLTLRRDNDSVPYMLMNGEIAFTGNDSSYFLDLRTDASDWRWMTLPDSHKVSKIKLPKNAELNRNVWVSYYDGQYRAEHRFNAWKDVGGDGVADTTFHAGDGFLFGVSLPGKSKKIYRFTFPNSSVANELIAKPIGNLYAWGGLRTDITENNKGWNLIGNPFTDNDTTDIGLKPIGIGKLEKQYDSRGNWTGGWVVVDGFMQKLRYGVFPVLDRTKWTEDIIAAGGYESLLFDDVVLKPFNSFFIQLGGEDTVQNVTIFKPIVDNPITRIIAKEQDDVHIDDEIFLRVKVGDRKTGCFISNRFTDRYEPGDDLESRYKIYQLINGYKLLYSAINDSIIERGVKVYTPTGNLHLDPKTNINDFEYIYAQYQNYWYDLLHGQTVDVEGEFLLCAKRKSNKISTEIKHLDEDVDFRKFIYNGNVYILKNNCIFNVLGEKIK